MSDGLTEAWALVRWNDNRTCVILAVFDSYEAALYQKGDSIRPELQIVKTTYCTSSSKADLTEALR